MSLPKVVSLLEEDVRDEALMYTSGYLRYFQTTEEHTEQNHSTHRTSITVAFPALSITHGVPQQYCAEAPIDGLQVDDGHLSATTLRRIYSKPLREADSLPQEYCLWECVYGLGLDFAPSRGRTKS